MENMINIDETIVIQLINFLVTVVVLNFLLINPVRKQIAARKNLTDGYASDIKKFAEDAHQKISGYEAALAEARLQASIDRDAIKIQGVSRQNALLEKAQSEAQTFLLASRERTARDARAAMDSLLSRIDTFASRSMKKILG